MASDLFRKNEVATVAGMAGTCGNAGLLIFSLLIGGLVATVGYTPFFICLGVLDLVGAVVLWTLVRERATLESNLKMSDALRESAIRSCRASIPTRRSSASATTITSPPRPSNGIPGVQIHHSRDLVHWRLLTRPLTRASQLNMLGDPGFLRHLGALPQLLPTDCST